jgi:uncharacterized membrane protein
MKTVRLIEIDALRGVAVALMVLFHGLLDAQLLQLLPALHLFEGPWIVFARLVQFVFLGLVGVSIFLSSRGFEAQLKRGVRIFLWGLAVSLGTWLVYPDDYVQFGILHCIGLAIPLVYLFKKKPYVGLWLAVLVFVLGEIFLRQTVESPYLFWLGLHRADFSSLDYFPIFPWLAVPLVGLWLGSRLYVSGQPTRLARLGKIPGLTFLGRHALAVYLLHQPLLYFSLWGLSHWIST